MKHPIVSLEGEDDVSIGMVRDAILKKYPDALYVKDFVRLELPDLMLYSENITPNLEAEVLAARHKVLGMIEEAHGAGRLVLLEKGAIPFLCFFGTYSVGSYLDTAIHIAFIVPNLSHDRKVPTMASEERRARRLAALNVHVEGSDRTFRHIRERALFGIHEGQPATIQFLVSMKSFPETSDESIRLAISDIDYWIERFNQTNAQDAKDVSALVAAARKAIPVSGLIEGCELTKVDNTRYPLITVEGVYPESRKMVLDAIKQKYPQAQVFPSPVEPHVLQLLVGHFPGDEELFDAMNEAQVRALRNVSVPLESEFFVVAEQHTLPLLTDGPCKNDFTAKIDILINVRDLINADNQRTIDELNMDSMWRVFDQTYDHTTTPLIYRTKHDKLLVVQNVLTIGKPGQTAEESIRGLLIDIDFWIKQNNQVPSVMVSSAGLAVKESPADMVCREEDATLSIYEFDKLVMKDLAKYSDYRNRPEYVGTTEPLTVTWDCGFPK